MTICPWCWAFPCTSEGGQRTGPYLTLTNGYGHCPLVIPVLASYFSQALILSSYAVTLDKLLWVLDNGPVSLQAPCTGISWRCDGHGSCGHYWSGKMTTSNRPSHCQMYHCYDTMGNACSSYTSIFKFIISKHMANGHSSHCWTLHCGHWTLVLFSKTPVRSCFSPHNK